MFAVRACELYLKTGGKFGLVLPNAAIDREHYAGFRSGHYGGKSGDVAIAFSRSWDLRRIRPHFFPRAACVVFGIREEHASNPVVGATWSGRSMPEEAELWTGRLRTANISWPEAKESLTRTNGKVRHIGQLTKSPYAPAFTQGATVLPRVAFVVEKQAASALGLPQGRIAVRSSRSVQEKKPWKSLPDITGVVESEFVRPYFTGDNVYPFRTGDPMLAVIPCGVRGKLEQGKIDLHPGLQQWWSRAEEIWNVNRSNGRMSLAERLDYQSTLSKQFPIPLLRVVYNRSGMHVVAAKLFNTRAILGSGLYWAPVHSEEEANYLCAVLNAPVTTELVRPFMTYGKDERDIAKHVWEVPIPRFDVENPIHRRLTELGKTAESTVAGFTINPDLHFAATRRHIRELLDSTDEGREINEIVFEMLS
ncbi:MAG: hypothetical protein E5X44_28145 [Mesorhizobium sp.]|nr:MAG: hypothetical protein E5X44_28145 [Mesorhizobium sp.]